MNALHKLLLIGTLCGAVPALATVISIQLSTNTVGPGQTFTLDVSIASASDLYAYQFDVGFDPTVLAANSVSEGAFLPEPGPRYSSRVSFNAGSLTGAVSGASGDGILATLSFTTIGSGSRSVGLFNVDAFDSFGKGIELTTSGADETVSGVPEPSSAILLGIGFLALMALMYLSQGLVPMRVK